MSAYCSVCKKKITATKSPGLQCSGPCKNFFHAACAGLSSVTLHTLSDEGISWSCSECRTDPGSPNKSVIIADTLEEIEANPTLNSILSYVKSTDEKLKGYQALIESVNSCKEKITQFQIKITTLEEKLNDITTLKNNYDTIQKELISTKSRCAELEQRSRIDNIELVGVTETPNENLHTVLEKIGQSINCSIKKDDYSIVHRVQPINSATNRPRNIIVKLISRTKKHEILAAAKRTKKSSKNIGTYGLKIQGLSESLFINEHLTSDNKLLLKRTKEAAKNKGFKFVWVRNCTIYVRKNETSPAKPIKSENDIARL